MSSDTNKPSFGGFINVTNRTMTTGNKITNAVTAAILAIGTFYLSQWALPEALASVKELAEIAISGIAGAVGVWLGNIIFRAFKVN